MAHSTAMNSGCRATSTCLLVSFHDFKIAYLALDGSLSRSFQGHDLFVKTMHLSSSQACTDWSTWTERQRTFAGIKEKGKLARIIQVNIMLGLSMTSENETRSWCHDRKT